MKFTASRIELRMVLEGLRSPLSMLRSCELADRLEAEANSYICPKSDDGEHSMFQPKDSDDIQWGEFGMCECCHLIRRMP